MPHIDFTDPSTLIRLKKPLENMRANNPPSDLQRFVSVMLVGIHTAEGNFETALEELKSSEKKGWRIPLYDYQMGSIKAAQGEHIEALQAYQKYVNMFGFDSDVAELIADSHQALGDEVEAKKAARKGLQDNPFSTGCFISFCRAAEPATFATIDFKAIVDAFGNKKDDPLDFALSYLVEEEQSERFEALLNYLRTNHADSHLIEFYDAQEAAE